MTLPLKDLCFYIHLNVPLSIAKTSSLSFFLMKLFSTFFFPSLCLMLAHTYHIILEGVQFLEVPNLTPALVSVDIYRPHTKYGQDNVFTGVCLFTGGGSVSRKPQYKDVYRRTIEMPQCARTFQVNCC